MIDMFVLSWHSVFTLGAMKAPYISLLLASFTLGKPSCRCLYGDTCWPNESDFASLAAQVSQPLLRPSPPESACYPATNPSGNCTAVVANTDHGRWRSDQPGSMQSPNFETYIFGNGTISACYLNTTLGVPCGQGSVPVIGVDARSVGDVQATVQFASKHNLRLVIKNTGHDYLGRSTARGSILLWTHHLKNIIYEEAFTPDGAPSGETYKAITLGAGVQWYEAYDAVEAEGRFILGGLSAGGSVGAAGGWVQGGGHSAFAATHGLGVDNVLQFTVVTASGKYLTVNSYKNSDLFWALRGGGGGTYAVVISATYVTHDRFPLSEVGFQANFSSPEIAKTVITEYIRLHPSLADAGWGGYSYLSAKDILFLYVAPNISLANANATLDPFVKLAQNATGGLAGAFTRHYDSFYPWYKATFGTEGQVGTHVELASRLLPRDMAENHAAEVTDVILGLEGGAAINFISGGAVSRFDPDSAGLHPAWRKAVAQVYVTEGWPEGTSVSDIRQARQRLRSKLDILDRLAPGSATYYNEATLYERDFKKSFFGPHYQRLKSIKAKYDPDTLFIVASGVGSEDWDGELNCRRH